MAFPTGWNRRCALVIQHGQVTADQTAFPVVITNASGCLPAEMVTTGGGNAAQSDGGDIRFTSDSAGTTQLACEIVAWSQNATAANAVAEIWVPVDVLAASNVTIYVWYNAGGGQTQPAAGASFGSQAVWDAHEVARFHLQTIGARPSGTTPDSTSFANDLVNSGSTNSVTTTTGAFGARGGNGGDFGSTNADAYLVKATPSSLPTNTAARTMVMWFQKPVSSQNWDCFGYGDNGGNGHRFGLFWNNTGILIAECSTIGATMPWTNTPSTWIHVAIILPSGTGNANTIKGYINGVSQTMSTVAGAMATPNSNLTMGRLPSVNSSYFNGWLDECGVSDIERSATWISTSYNNQSAPGSFIIASSPVTPGGSGGLFSISTNLSGIGTGGPFFTNPLN